MADGVHLLTGHQETNHITAAEEGAANSAFFSIENSVIISTEDAESLLTVNVTAGTVSLGECTALFTGRKVVVTGGAAASYTKPSSGSVYRRVSAGLLYTRDTETDEEDVSFVCYTSASDAQPASAAYSADTGSPTSSEIGSASTTVYFELADIVVSSTAIDKIDMMFNVTVPYSDFVESMNDFASDIGTRMTSTENGLTGETAARQTADTGLGNRISTLETNAAKIKKLTPTSIATGSTTTEEDYTTEQNLLLFIVNTPSGVSSFVCCRYGSENGGTAPVLGYIVAGNREILVTFVTNRNEVHAIRPTNCEFLAVYEIKAV